MHNSQFIIHNSQFIILTRHCKVTQSSRRAHYEITYFNTISLFFLRSLRTRAAWLRSRAWSLNSLEIGHVGHIGQIGQIGQIGHLV